MIDIDFIRNQALSFEETSEGTHFEKASFKVKNKIFLTLDEKNELATLKLSLADQDVFSTLSKGSIQAVNNKWGLQGWTTVDLRNTEKDLFEDALKCAYCQVAPLHLAQLYKDQ